MITVDTCGTTAYSPLIPAIKAICEAPFGETLEIIMNHADAFQDLIKISGITSKNGRNDAKRLNIRVVTVSNDDKPKNRKTQRKADLRRRMVCKSLPVKE